MKINKFSLLFLIVLPGFLTACGFHLRGEQDLSAVLPEVKIQGIDKYSELGRDLSRALRAAKVNLDDESDVVLEVGNDNLTKRVLSVDSAGRANQYELNYQISFKLMKRVKENEKARMQVLLPQQTVSAKREFLFDANLVLAKADEERQLKKDMREDVILQLIRRLVFLLKAENKNSLQPQNKMNQ